MRKLNYAVIGKGEDGKYAFVTPGYLEMLKAIDLSNDLGDGWKEKRVVRFEYAQIMVDALNGDTSTSAESLDVLHGNMEATISQAIRSFVALFPARRPRIKEVFVGHETYEVQVILEEEPNA